MTDEEYFRKLTAETHIDELAKISKRGKPDSVPDKDGRHGVFAENGWNYRTAFFQDFDNKYYRLKISVALGRNGKTVYNVAEIRERSPLTSSGSSASAALNDERTSNVDSISDDKQIVNYDIAQKLTRHNGGQNSMGRSFKELAQNQTNSL